MGKSLGMFFRHNLWSNLQLLECCAGVSDELLDASAPGTYGTVRATLVHLFAAEQRYTEALTGEPNPEPRNENQDFPGFDYLRRSARDSGEKLVQVAETAQYDEFRSGTRRGEPFELPAITLLLQAINHATEHRSHITTILTQNGVEVPSLDGWSFGDEVLALLPRR